MAIALGAVANAQISTLTAKLHVDDEFEAYLSTSPTELGTQFVSGGIPWNDFHTGSISLTTPGTYWLHVRARDQRLPAMILGEFELTGLGVFKKNGTNRLITSISNFTGWTGSGPGVTPATLFDRGPNGTGPWGSLPSVAADARFIWGRDAQGELTGTSRPLFISTQFDVYTYFFLFTLNKATVAGQNSVLGTVTLEAASTKATPVTITPSSSLITAPPKVYVAAGQLVRNFMMTVAPVTSPAMTVISAKVGSLVRSQGLLLTPLVPTAMAFTPSQVTGGTDVSCRLVINGVAGPGGRIISVFDTSTYATTPNSVTVPPGATQVVFLIGTKPVTTIQTVSVTARVSAGERTGTFRIYPHAQ